MRKYSYLIILLVFMLLFPTIVYAEDNTVEKSILSNISSRIKNYIEEYKDNNINNNSSEEDTPIVDISIVTNDNDVTVDVNTNIDEQLKNTNINSITNTNFNLENIDTILKDSKGSITNTIKNTISTKNSNMLGESNIDLGNNKTKYLSYCLNDKKSDLSLGNSNLLFSNINYNKLNLLGDTTRLLETNAEISNENEFGIDVDKSNAKETSFYDVLVNAKTGASLNLGVKYFRKGLFKDYNIDKSIKLKGEWSYSKPFKIPAPNDEEESNNNNTNTNTDNSSGIATTTYTNYQSANTMNPSTMDKLGVYIMLLVLSIISFFGAIYTKKYLYNN